MNTARSAPLAFWVLLTACGDNGGEPPPAAVPVAAYGPVQLEADLVLARIVADDPLLEDLAKITRSDEFAAASKLEIHQEQIGNGDEGRRDVSFLAAPDRAALASYLGSVLSRHSQLQPAEGQGFAFEQIETEKGLRWRTHLLERSSALRPRTLQRLEIIREDGSGFQLRMKFGEQDGKAFHAMTQQAEGHRIAIAIGEEVIAAPTVAEPIPGGEVIVTPARGSGRERVEQWARRLQGP